MSGFSASKRVQGYVSRTTLGDKTEMLRGASELVRSQGL